ncbi:MAG TPA: sigma factor [Terriglobia bacterium]|nr:sigma factor [Terriglobia bacterium]
MPRRAKSATTATATAITDLENLLSQAANGDREAFGGIYDRMAPRILGLIERILGASGPGEQVLEDVFVELWNSSRSLAGGHRSVAAWLTFRARAAALDRLSGGPSRPLRRRDAGSRSSAWVAWLPGAEAIRRMEQRRPLLARILGQLPREQLKAVELVAFEGRAETEIADQLHEPLAKVKAELRAAARFLKHRRRAVVGAWAVNI